MHLEHVHFSKDRLNNGHWNLGSIHAVIVVGIVQILPPDWSNLYPFLEAENYRTASTCRLISNKKGNKRVEKVSRTRSTHTVTAPPFYKGVSLDYEEYQLNCLVE